MIRTLTGRRWHGAGAALIAAASIAALASCSSGGSSSPASSGAPSSLGGSGSAADAGPSTFEGPSAKFFSTTSAPKTVSGTKFVLGYSDPYAAIPGLLAQQKAACAEAIALGGSCIAKDANVSVQNQVSQVNEMLTQGVTAIAISPLNPQALLPSFTAAQKAKVPVVGSELPSDASQSTLPVIATTVNQGMDYGAWATMREIAKAMPGAEFGVLGTASPNPTLQYLIAQQKSYAQKFGLKFLGEVDAQQDTPTQWAQAGTTLVTKYPSMKVLLAYNDPSALAAAGAIRSSGNIDVKVADANGYSASAKTAIASGSMIASYAVPVDEIGKAMAIAAYTAQTGGTLPKVTVIKGQVVTKANADSVPTVG